jgi:hypothetical protein
MLSLRFSVGPYIKGVNQQKGNTVTEKIGSRRVASVIDSADYSERKTKRMGNLAKFFASSPLKGSGLTVPRRKDRPPRVDP